MIPGASDITASLVFEPSTFGWLGLLAILVGIAAVVFAYTAGLRWRQHPLAARVTLLSLRLGALVCLLIALLHPAWISESFIEQQPIVAVVLDTSESMSRVAGDKEHKDKKELSRYDRAVALLQDKILPGLDKTHEVRLFDIQARAMKLTDLPETPDDRRSPLTETLLCVEQNLKSQPLVGIVLLSDGTETADRPTIGSIERLRTPVHAIEITRSYNESPTVPDLAIQSVSANRRALVNNTIRITVDISGGNEMPGDGPVEVSILDGGRAVATSKINWPAGESAIRTELDLIPRRPGEFIHTVQVSPLPGETNLADNRATFPLSVRAEALTVLYVDGVLRWEGKFIRQALAADPDINVVSSIRVVQPGSDQGSQGLLLADQLANINVVIIGDVEATYFSSGELEALRSWVTDSSGALLLTGGYLSFGPNGIGRTTLSAIMPVEFSAAANPQWEQPFSLKLTETGQQHPIFYLTGDRVRDTAFFQSLPQLEGCSRIAAVKPAAEVLAVNPQITGPEGVQGLPVMVVQQVGSGRTMVFSVDTTWRWRMVVGGFTGDSSFYQQFWGQLVRWLASTKEQDSPQLFLSTDRYRYKLGQTIELNIELGRPAGESIHGLRPYRVTAKAMDEVGTQVDIPLAELGNGKYKGTLAAPRPGRLDLLALAEPIIAAEGPADDTEIKTMSQLITVQVDRPDLEMLDPKPNPQWLMQAAQITGGKYLKPEQVESWAEKLPDEPVKLQQVRTKSLWRHPLLATVFFILLCGEWILRRRSRLA